MRASQQVKIKLMSRVDYDQLPPHLQGYATYMQAGWPASELPKSCPYAKDTMEGKEWRRGNRQAMFDVMDSEE